MPLKEYEDSFSNFFELVVFDYTYDPSIKLALKHDLSVEQAMSEPTLAEQWRSIMMELEQDATPNLSQLASHHSLGLASHPEHFEFHVQKKKAI